MCPRQSPHAPSKPARPPKAVRRQSANPTTPAAPPATPPPGAHRLPHVPAPRESNHSMSSFKSASVQHRRQPIVPADPAETSPSFHAASETNEMYFTSFHDKK